MSGRILLLVLALSAAWSVAAAAEDVSCYVMNRSGAEYRIPSWNRLVVRERETEPPGAAAADSTAVPRSTLDSPGVLRALVYRGAVIPVEDVKYMLPGLGIYVLKDGHRIEANPLSNCGYSREHRFADLEHSRHRTTAGGAETPSGTSAPLLLEAFVEYAATDTVAGYPVAESRVLSIGDARIVVFDAEFIQAARDLWMERSSSGPGEPPFLPYTARMGKRTDLLFRPRGEEAARLEKGTVVEILEEDDGWVRVKVEGWVKSENVEEKKP